MISRFFLIASMLCLGIQDLEADSISLANELGAVLASEEFCGLAYNQAAIQQFIESHVKADDMGFAGMLNLMTTGHEVEIKDLSPSRKAAHCAQIARVARSYNFTK